MRSILVFISGLMVFDLAAAWAGEAGARALRFEFDRPGATAGLTIEGSAAVDTKKNHGPGPGGALRIGPGAKVLVPLCQQNRAGQIELWVFDDGSAPADPKQRGAGPLWGLTQREGRLLAVGPVYAPYLSGDRSYAATEFDPAKNERPWWEVQYLAVRRRAGWHRWTFRFDADAGLRILQDGQDVNARHKVFYWNRTSLRGVTGLVFLGDATSAKQTLWVDDVCVRLDGPPRVEPVWPPPPPPALAPLPPGPGWKPQPYARWKNGLPDRPDFFPIAVWLQDPKNARRYRQAGFNLYIGLWKGPTEEQLAALREAGMPVICSQNEVARRHLDDPILVGWMHGDEPDNAQPRPDGKGYGPPIRPEAIQRHYREIVAVDPTRPVLLNLGQAVAWDGWHGRGVRSRHPEDYPEYVKGCDIVSFDIYPVVHTHPDVAGRLWYVPHGVTRLRRWTDDRKVVWNCIECTHIGNPRVEPTPHQVRAEVWMSIIFGSRGLIYFVHQFKPKFIEAGLLADKEMLAAVTAINRQIQSLAPVINSPTVAGAASVRSSNPRVPVRLTARRYRGATYLFAVSLFHQDTQATFRVQGIGPRATVEVLGENRTLTAENGRFEDAFGGYDVHLYRIAD